MFSFTRADLEAGAEAKRAKRKRDEADAIAAKEREPEQVAAKEWAEKLIKRSENRIKGCLEALYDSSYKYLLVEWKYGGDQLEMRAAFKVLERELSSSECFCKVFYRDADNSKDAICIYKDNETSKSRYHRAGDCHAINVEQFLLFEEECAEANKNV